MIDITTQVTERLAELGYPDVKSFQAASGLTADGVAGHDTLTAMGLGDLFKLPLGQGQTQLPVKNTPLSAEEAAQTLSQAFQGPVSAEILALLMAQTAHETADWTRLPNYNFGGIKMQVTDPYVQAFISPEGAGAAERLYVSGFAAYTSALDGAAAYVRVLASRTSWWQGLLTGTPEGLVAGLSTKPFAYFTGDPAAYLVSVRARFEKYLELAQQYAG